MIKALRAGRNRQEIARFLKVHRSLIYLLKKVFELKPGCWVGRCPSYPKLTQKGLLASHGQWILWPGHPKNSQNHPGLVKANLKDYWSKEIWPPSSKLIQIRSFGLTMTVDFVAWPPKTQSKAPRTGLKAILKDRWSKESGLPVQKIVIL